LDLRRAIIFVKDLEVMREFYRDTLGLRPIPGSEEPGWVEFDAGNSRLALHAIPTPIADAISIADPPRPREDTPIKLVFLVGDVDAERSRLVAQGVTMFPTRPWGACDGIDPEGNVFQIAGA
jgi:catechol 2,3-dioxygenase-like lactoylglutathione lyase family enzyme